MSRILLVEDEQHLANGLRFNLEAEGYEVKITSDGETALDLLLPAASQQQPFDAVVLDVMLPGKDGFEIATELRAAGQFVPILMLTARGRAEDVLRGFAAGADDYLPKPFELRILLARLGGLLRRHAWLRQSSQRVNHRTPLEASAQRAAGPDDKPEAEQTVCNFAGKKIDFGALELHASGRTIQLTLMEADLLRFLLKHEGQAVSRKAMLEEVWGLREDTDTRAIDNFIVRLRKYIEDEPSQPKHLLTVRGVGYRFVANPER